MKKIELLAPAGDLVRLKTAIMYGADAVYIGGKSFSLRTRASNFSIEDIREGVKFANQYNASIHVTINMLPHHEDFIELDKYLKELEEAGVSAVIVASAYIMQRVKLIAPKLEIHVSTQHSSTNSKTIQFWNTLGASRVVLARECTLDDIVSTSKNSVLPTEVFIHGGMCISYSGRCVLSNHMTSRDANRGGCAQSCRWKYRLYDKEELISNELDLFSMSSKDLMAAKYISKLIDANVSSLKIEGRMKTSYYVATIVSTYRRLIDEYYELNKLDENRINYYINELSKAENRPTGVGFYAGLPSYKDHLYGINGAGVTQEFICIVLDYDKVKKQALIEVRNFFDMNDECEIFGPKRSPRSFQFKSIEDDDGNTITQVRNPMQRLYVDFGFEVEKDELVRKLIIKDRTNVY